MDEPAVLLWLVPALPLAGALVLALMGRRWPETWIARLACATVAASAVLAAIMGADYLAAPGARVQVLWSWFTAGELSPAVALRLDGLSLVMVAVITGIGFLVHLYSSAYMAGEEGYGRYFAWLNLFVAAMLVLVLADDLLLLFVGWELVGLCSYLLIGFWYRDPANGAAARKALIMTMAGDVPLVIGLLLLFSSLGSTAMPTLLGQAAESWPPGTALPITAALLLAFGAIGKSAQLPLHTWLPSAMAGPTPVSALLHAATMVTAGVYLIARLHPLFALAPPVLAFLAWLGAITLLLAGLHALVQNDIKRVLAWSTVSQLGFMFMALGVGAVTAAMFHLFVHAFFKALLFLAAGVAILALGHEQDLRRMGGLQQRAPWAFWGFLAGGASLAAVPFISAGFFSKELILAALWQRGGGALWAVAWVGAVLTAAYITRAFIIGFLGAPVTPATGATGWRMHLPVALLVLPTLGAGWLAPPFGALLAPASGATLPATETAFLPALLAALAPLLGIAFAWYALHRRPASAPPRLASVQDTGFDRFYGAWVRGPYRRLAQRLADDPFDRPFMAAAHLAHFLWQVLSATQDGRLRRYALVLVAGTAVLLAMVMT
ncbi:MAG: NADH-quinone oxidoreductase subunit L [Gammaproteobacteria bacterium]|nr:NADH-quinone oxidoreductase subunit L [Gammaproteobacteria bacterium]